MAQQRKTRTTASRRSIAKRRRKLSRRRIAFPLCCSSSSHTTHLFSASSTLPRCKHRLKQSHLMRKTQFPLFSRDSPLQRLHQRTSNHMMMTSSNSLVALRSPRCLKQKTCRQETLTSALSSIRDTRACEFRATLPTSTPTLGYCLSPRSPIRQRLSGGFARRSRTTYARSFL